MTYQASDLAWMDMKNNTIEIVIGPIETYEDQLLGAKAGYEAYVLIKDKAWSGRLARYAALLPGLQRSLPVGEAYKREVPGTDAELNAYDLVYVAGDGNHGSKNDCHQTCRTTKRFSSPRGRDAFKSRTSCERSSTPSWSRSPTPCSPKISART